MAEERMETFSPIPPPPFRPIIGQPLSTLDEWLKVFEEYVKLKQITDEKEKNNLLLSLQSDKVRSKLWILCYPFEPSRLPYSTIYNTLKTMDDDPAKVLIGSRSRFFKSRQRASQSLSVYAEQLRTLAEFCHFPSEAIHENELELRFRLSIYDRNIKEKLEMMKDEQNGLEKILKFAMQFEKPLNEVQNSEDMERDYEATRSTVLRRPSPLPGRQHVAALGPALQPQKSSLSADEMMNSFYPNWWSELSTETVCIPACLDVVTNAYRGPSDPQASNYDEILFSKKKRFYEGQNAEDTFLRAFQKLNLGGVLVCGFNSIDFAAKKNKTKNYIKFGIEGFEIDAIFIHPRMGIFAFEIKATKKIRGNSDIPVFNNQYEKAESQLNKMRKQIPKIFEKICNCSQHDAQNITVHLSVCFPFSCLDDRKQSSFIHIDESHFLDQGKMRKLFVSRMTFQPEKIELLEHLKMFACAIAGYRTAEFVSAGCNALEVHKIIDLQNFGGGFKSSGCFLFWTNEQLTILECNDRHQIIYGPPGTGKTLVLIQKAYKAAQSMKDGGSLYILTSQPELLLRFKKHFENIDEKLVRQPILVQKLQELQKPLNRDDDIFIDEFIVSPRALLQFVSTCDNVVIVANGYAQPHTTQDIEDYKNTKGLEKVTFFPMNTVIRSSKSIYNEWKREFIHTPIKIGHNCRGPSVTRITAFNSNQILENMIEIIEKLERQIGSNFHSNLAIIADSCDEIQEMLSAKNVSWGTVEEQLKQDNRISVSHMYRTVSLEWPFVILISLTSIDLAQSLFLIGASRCMSHLFIIERDYMSVQAAIEEKFKTLRDRQEFIDIDKFAKIVSDAGYEFGETRQIVSSHDRTFARIRLDYISDDIVTFSRKFKVFDEHNNTLFHCFKAIAHSTILCKFLLCVAKSERMEISFLEEYRETIRSTSGTRKQLFDRLCSHKNERERTQMWEIFNVLINKLVLVADMKNIEKDNEELNRLVEMKEVFIRIIVCITVLYM